MNVNSFLREVLADPLANETVLGADDQPAGTVTMTTRLMANHLDFLPLVHARHVTGSELNPNFDRDWASITVDVYASDEIVAERVSAVTRQILRAAWAQQTVYPSGYVSQYRCLVVPFLFPRGEQADDSSRYTAEYRLLVSPAT